MPVYVVKAEGTNTVKIGYTEKATPRTRFSQIQAACPFKLVPKFFIPHLNRTDEKEIHKRFDKYRTNREWFEFSSEIESFFISRYPEFQIDDTMLQKIEGGSRWGVWRYHISNNVLHWIDTDQKIWWGYDDFYYIDLDEILDSKDIEDWVAHLKLTKGASNEVISDLRKAFKDLFPHLKSSVASA